ncbi:hypothetical protein ACIBCM_08575, partial [Streptomyces sp. NPDC051018]|uniref:hypothetical protein n=1 Tax=Streptomyces sp. NPDC051018 TaxID=3365639 RepID=UPI0037A13F04
MPLAVPPRAPDVSVLGDREDLHVVVVAGECGDRRQCRGRHLPDEGGRNRVLEGLTGAQGGGDTPQIPPGPGQPRTVPQPPEDGDGLPGADDGLVETVRVLEVRREQDERRGESALVPGLPVDVDAFLCCLD